jgi:isoquinoline 1-oxidoreductase alpha subunit
LLVPLPLAVRAQPAYTVFVAGSPVRSCSMPVAEVGAADITTVEGVGGREAAAVPEGLDLA